MKQTIDTSIKPDWFDLELPEERKYWSMGAGKNFGRKHRVSLANFWSEFSYKQSNGGSE